MIGPDGHEDRHENAPPERAVLLATKLHIPATTSSGLVDRAALLETVAGVAHHKLTLLSAPAGWGKTTLLAQWVASTPHDLHLGWLTLDSSDNDPVWFWMYAIAAVQQAAPGVGAASVQLLAMGADPIRVALPRLLNELDVLTTPIALILDDYHRVTSYAVHEQMTFVLGRMPANLHLVLATRSDPMLPLARLRAEGDLVEIRAGDLGFDTPQSAHLLGDMFGLKVAPADIEFLRERTEGWAAGLYLAALCMRGRSDVAAFIKAFAGDNRHIVDYLMAEVLDDLTPQVRSFLLRTSVLERLSADLCDAVLNTTGSASILEGIERDNLFVVPLDLSRRWYRYHQLFAELLRAELRRSEPDLIGELHLRAAAWFEAAHLVDEALHHLAASGDTAATVDLIAADWANEFNQGGLSTISGWLDLLSDQTVLGDPRLAVARAWIAVTSGRFDEAAQWIDAIQTASSAQAKSDASLDAQLAVLRGTQFFKTGDLPGALEAAAAAIHLDLDATPLACTGAYTVYGSALYFAGRPREAQGAFEQAIQVAEQVRDRRARVTAEGYLAMILAEDEQWAAAEATVRRASGSDRDLTEPQHNVDIMVALAVATILDWRDDTAAAMQAADAALMLARHSGGIYEIAKALDVAAGILAQHGDDERAHASRREASALFAAAADFAAIPADGFSSRGADDGDPALDAPLTPREREVLHLLATRLSRHEIAERLVVSINTVKTHQRAVYRKLGVQGRRAAISRARDLGLL